MNIELELSRRLNEWFSSRRKMMDWVARHDDSNPDVEVAQYSELRDRCYDCEWELLSLGARQEVWEKLLENESDIDRDEAMDLRTAMPDLDIVSGRQRAFKDGLTVSTWWFIPYAVWVGLPRNSAWGHPVDHAKPMLDRVTGLFRDAAQTVIPERISEEQQASGNTLKATFQFVPGINADKLREFMLPPGALEDWPVQDRNALEFIPDMTSPMRAGCVGVYLAANNYRSLALVRDMVRDMAMIVAQENHDPHLKLGPLMPRRMAVGEAELLRWELWTEQLMAAPLVAEAKHRHVSFTVERERGEPVRLLVHAADMDGQDVHASQRFECRVNSNEMLHHALNPFIESSRTDMDWSVRQLEMTSKS